MVATASRSSSESPVPTLQKDTNLQYENLVRNIHLPVVDIRIISTNEDLGSLVHQTTLPKQYGTHMEPMADYCLSINILGAS